MTVLVTGASSGIGAAAAVELTRLGVAVLATGRSATKLEHVHLRMLAVAPAGVTVPQPVAADLSALSEVHRLADVVKRQCASLNVLVNNAAVQPKRRAVSSDGYELALAVNHVAPFALTQLLVERLLDSAGRVVTTASSTHTKGSFDFDDLQMEHGWSSLRAYGRSKLANILFTAELARRTGLPASCFHPGNVCTDINRDSRWFWLTQPLERILFAPPERGAQTLVWLATSDEGAKPSAVYYEDQRPAHESSTARDTALASRLWQVSEHMAGLDGQA